MGPSILDLTESNPSSRLRMSEFRNLQGLRNALRNDIERGLLRADPIQKVSSILIKLLLNFGSNWNKKNYHFIFFFEYKKSNIQHKSTNELSNKKRIVRRIIVIRKKSQLIPIRVHGPLESIR